MSKGYHIVTILLGLSSTFFYAMVQVVIKVCLNKLALTSTLHEKIHTFLPFGILVMVLGAVGFLLWSLALNRAEISEVYWTTAFAYIIVPLLSYFFLRERPTDNILIGYVLISVGAVFASYSR